MPGGDDLDRRDYDLGDALRRDRADPRRRDAALVSRGRTYSESAVGAGGGASPGGACTAAMFSGRRRLAYSMMAIWIAAATGMASRAPSTPNRVEPKRTDV